MFHREHGKASELQTVERVGEHAYPGRTAFFSCTLGLETSIAVVVGLPLCTRNMAGTLAKCVKRYL